MFIVGRTIAGLGAAGVLQGTLSIISHVVELEKRPLYMGVVISVFVIAVCGGPPLGGVLTQKTTWRWCFWINLPLGAVVLILISIFARVQIPENENRSLTLPKKLANMDPIGCLLFIGSICCLIFALQWGGQSKPWNSPSVIGLLVPYMLFGESVCIVGTALLSKIGPTTPTMTWAAYMVVAGVGMGIAQQLPYTAVQVTLTDDDLPTGNAIAVLFYQLGAAIAIAMGQTITIGTIRHELPKHVPDLPAGAILTAGAANLSQLTNSPDVLDSLRLIWSKAIDRTMLLSVSFVAASVPFTLGMEWINAKKVAQARKQVKEPQVEQEKLEGQQ
ncbi:MAG: hypothetical protein Q9216_005288 [Gyalolechia sp. 2 TL-2023]